MINSHHKDQDGSLTPLGPLHMTTSSLHQVLEFLQHVQHADAQLRLLEEERPGGNDSSSPLPLSSLSQFRTVSSVKRMLSGRRLPYSSRSSEKIGKQTFFDPFAAHENLYKLSHSKDMSTCASSNGFGSFCSTSWNDWDGAVCSTGPPSSLPSPVSEEFHPNSLCVVSPTEPFSKSTPQPSTIPSPSPLCGAVAQPDATRMRGGNVGSLLLAPAVLLNPESVENFPRGSAERGSSTFFGWKRGGGEAGECSSPSYPTGHPTSSTILTADGSSTSGGGGSEERGDCRRHSANCEELRAEFERRVRHNRALQRRRKSVDEVTLTLAAVHAHQMQGIREYQSPHSANSFSSRAGRGLLRSRSTWAMTEGSSLGGLTEGRRKPLGNISRQTRLAKQRSLCAITTSTMTDTWPSTITSMLTSGQSLRDRLHLFYQLENILSSANQTAQRMRAAAAAPPSPSYSKRLSERSTSSGLSSSTSVSVAPVSDLTSSTPTNTIIRINKSVTPRSTQSTRGAPPLFTFPLPSKRTEGLRIVCGGWSIPRPDKTWKGEDAYFLCSQGGGGFIGVADGVGEWCELGCNPRQFAEEFMQGGMRTAEAICRDPCNPFYSASASRRALHVLEEGYNSTSAFGSCTALVAGLDSEGKSLGVANLGDSALIVLRRESRCHRHFTVCRRTKEQQHFFNCPYQLSRVPSPADVPDLEERGMHRLVRALNNLQSNFEGDRPELADLYDIKLQEGDLIIAGTDGLLDNLFDREVASLVSLCLSPYEASILAQVGLQESFPHPDSILLPEQHPEVGFATPPEKIARAVAEAAFYRSVDPMVKTPFAAQSRKSGGFFYGGKMDDITVVAMWVV